MKLFWNKTNEHKIDAKKKLLVLRKVFSSPEGAVLLKMLLVDWNFFDLCETEQQKALNEYAKIFIEDLRAAGIDLTANIDITIIEEQSND
jgi:hypothetical protein